MGENAKIGEVYAEIIDVPYEKYHQNSRESHKQPLPTFNFQTKHHQTGNC